VGSLWLVQIVGTVEVDPTSPETLYAGSYGSSVPGGSFDSNVSVFKSLDGGQTWQSVRRACRQGRSAVLSLILEIRRLFYAGLDGAGSDAFVAKLDAGAVRWRMRLISVGAAVTWEMRLPSTLRATPMWRDKPLP
jgi:hypothetical protein